MHLCSVQYNHWSFCLFLVLMSCLVVCPLFVPEVSVVGAALAIIVIKLHLNTPTVYILPVLHLVCDIVYYLSP